MSTEAVAGIGAALFTFLLRLPFLGLPFGQQDEGYYAMIARATAAGAGLYTDLGYVRPPGLNAVYAIAWHISDLLGVGYDVTLRVMATLVASATVGIFGAYLFRRFRTLAATMGTLLAALLTASLALQNEANAETWLMLPYAASAVLVLRAFEDGTDPRRRRLWLVAGGALTGTAALLKEVALVNLALPLVAGATLLGRQRIRETVSATLAYAGGTMAVLLAALLGLLMTGEARAFLYHTWFTRLAYAADSIEQPGTMMVLRRQLAFIGRALVWPGVATAVAAAPAVFVRDDERSSERRVLLAAIGWLALAGVGIVASGRFYEHYFIQATLPLALVLSAALATISAPARPTAWSRVAATSAVIMAVLACGSTALSWMNDAGTAPRLHAGRSEWRDLAERVDAVTPAGGTLFIWGDVASLAAYTQSPDAAATLAAFYPLGKPGGETALGADFPSVGDRVYAALRNEPPDTIVATAQLGDRLPGVRRSVFTPRDDTRAEDLLLAMLENEYEEMEQGPGYIVFERAERR